MKARRQAWWASLTSDEKAAYIERRTQRKEAARQDNPSRRVQEATARLDLATERGCFMRDIPDADVRHRMETEREQK